MRIKLLFFAGARDAFGPAEAVMEFGEGATPESLLSDPRFAALAPLRPSLRFAVNEEFASPEAVLSDGDVLAFIPPVSGG